MPKEVDCNFWQTSRMGGCSKTKWHFASFGKPFRQCGDEIGALKNVPHRNEMRNDQAHLAFDARALKQAINFTMPCICRDHANMVKFCKLFECHWRFGQWVSFAKNTHVLVKEKTALKETRLQVGQ